MHFWIIFLSIYFFLDKQIGTIYKWYYQYKIIPYAQLKRWLRTLIEMDTQRIQNNCTCRTGESKTRAERLKRKGVKKCVIFTGLFGGDLW